ncbi:IS1634 family transposase [Propioniciclava sp.]|uniref:IS1634 family transposase n=1 Tax=Propioniciclava sp. TaxID=2038686 RepID=UPI0026265F2A|nr:IS1634 family transposase [Propioniciclava sp.]
MYLRTTQRRNKDGSVVRYVQVAHNRKVDGVTQAEVLVNLGREDALDRAGLARLVASINRYLGTTPDQADVGIPGEQLTVAGSRPMGTVHLLDGLWHTLGVDDALKRALGPRRFTTDVERVLFALVANRAIDPRSKLSAAEWASCDVTIPGLTGMDEDQAYRAMDALIDADAQARVQEAVFFAVAHLLNLEVDVLLFDTTSTYFERDTEETGDTAFRLYGHSKDHRTDLPQVVIGLAVTKEGIPVRCWCWPGNTTDTTVLPQVKDDLRLWRLGRVVTVVDRGFSSEANLAYLKRAGGHYIAGERMRDGSSLVEAALSRQGRYSQVRDNLRVKEVKLDAAPDRRWVICHNPAEAERDKTQRDHALEAVQAELDRIKTLRDKATATGKTGMTTPKTPAKTNADTAGDANPADTTEAKPAPQPAHVKAECALRDHPALGRWVKQLPTGRLTIDRAKVTAEERLDGKYLLTTSDPDLSAEDVALGYKNLLEAERGFRDLKSTLELRPVYHRLEPRIRAHVLLCWLALLLIRVAERSTGQTWRRIAIELGRIHAVTLTGTAGTVVHVTPLNTTQAGILQACKITPPPAVTTLTPA